MGSTGRASRPDQTPPCPTLKPKKPSEIVVFIEDFAA